MSEFNSEPIDIIVPWVNPNDPVWRKDFEYWKQKETGQKDACRFRDMGVFNYWFRCIEKNMPWVRYVFLVLASPSQIPSWLNVNHPKLKIVYHEQFIPKEELPTFNSSVINCYMPFIEELSDNYILFNDDFFVVKPVYENEFFVNNRPCIRGHLMSMIPRGNTPWYNNIGNNFNYMNKLFGKQQHLYPDHGPIAFIKNLQLFIWNKMENEFTNALNNSRFRKNKNITDWIFLDAQHLTKKINNNSKSIVQYINKPNFHFNNKIICLNDNERLSQDQYNQFKIQVKNELNKILKNKSNFENE